MKLPLKLCLISQETKKGNFSVKTRTFWFFLSSFIDIWKHFDRHQFQQFQPTYSAIKQRHQKTVSKKLIPKLYPQKFIIYVINDFFTENWNNKINERETNRGSVGSLARDSKYIIFCYLRINKAPQKYIKIKISATRNIKYFCFLTRNKYIEILQCNNTFFFNSSIIGDYGWSSQTLMNNFGESLKDGLWV